MFPVANTSCHNHIFVMDSFKLLLMHSPIYQRDSTVWSGRYELVYGTGSYNSNRYKKLICRVVRLEVFKINDPMIVGTIRGLVYIICDPLCGKQPYSRGEYGCFSQRLSHYCIKPFQGHFPYLSLSDNRVVI